MLSAYINHSYVPERGLILISMKLLTLRESSTLFHS